MYSKSLPNIPNVLVKFGTSDRFLNIGDIVTIIMIKMNIKYLGTLVLLVVLVIGISGCLEQTEKPTSTYSSTPTPAITPTLSPTPIPTPEFVPEISVGKWEWKINKNQSAAYEAFYKYNYSEAYSKAIEAAPIEARFIDFNGKEIARTIVSSRTYSSSVISLQMAPPRTTPIGGTYTVLVEWKNHRLYENNFTFKGANLSVDKRPYEFPTVWTGMSASDVKERTFVGGNLRIFNLGDMPAYLLKVTGKIEGSFGGDSFDNSIKEWVFPRDNYYSSLYLIGLNIRSKAGTRVTETIYVWETEDKMSAIGSKEFTME